MRQTRAVLDASRFAVELDPVEPAALVFVPPVLGYRMLGPVAFAEFEASRTETANPLESSGAASPGPLGTATPVLAPPAVPVDGGSIVGAPRAMDRGFWYLVFAGYLDARTAFAASESVVESAVTMADRGGTPCVYATFAGGDLAQTATLRDAVERWAFTVPAEFTPAVSVLPDGTLQLLTCDPGSGFENGSRLGVARELVAWRTVELATYELVTDGTTGVPATGSRPDVEVAWAIVASSTVPADVAALRIDLPPADVAAAARAAVAAVLAPAD
jgi:hypothetical protein